jgi:hypothetical protein
MARTAGLLALGLVVLSTSAAAARAARIDPWAKLRRPLHVSRIEPGARCPVSPARRVSSAFARAQGGGPVHAVGGFPALQFIYPPVPEQVWYGSEWSGNKVLWIGRPGYRGPILIRGRQLDGPHGLRFEGGLHPARELRLPGGGGTQDGWRQWPSYTRVRAAGCYAWQVDGLTFSRVIVFRAVQVEGVKSQPPAVERIRSS